MAKELFTFLRLVKQSEFRSLLTDIQMILVSLEENTLFKKALYFSVKRWKHGTRQLAKRSLVVKVVELANEGREIFLRKEVFDHAKQLISL